MCILPNFEAGDLAAVKQRRKEDTTKVTAKHVRIILPQQQLLKNSI